MMFGPQCHYICTERSSNTEFNLEFHLPKKDRCDYCEEYRVNVKPSEDDAAKYNVHERAKTEAKSDTETYW